MVHDISMCLCKRNLSCLLRLIWDTLVGLETMKFKLIVETMSMGHMTFHCYFITYFYFKEVVQLKTYLL
jgi:hypothetical protein